MRIGIDYTAAVRQGAGIGRYTRNLVRALAHLDTCNQYRLVVAGAGCDREDMGTWPENYRLRVIPATDRWLHIMWQRLQIPIPVQAITGRLDLFHSPDFVLPPTGKTPALLTVHDLSYLRVPQYFVAGFSRYLHGAVSRAVRRAERILADSESTRRDLLELLHVEPERVSVLLPGVERRFQPIEDVDALSRVRRRYQLPKRFILGLGTLQPRKNFAGLIEAFARLIGDGREFWPADSLHLVIAGGKGWMYEEIIQLVEDLDLGARVRFPGFVDDEDLPALYSLADVFAFPSWYEGFGLPVLEAMACGTPVVAADNSSLPEVVGEAGILVPADDSSSLAEAVARLLTDKPLRAKLVAAGRAQAQRFTWESAARQLLEEYEAAAGN